ncbi:hypothetical protein R5R35_007762 [Gryllus longicercus]|uniref:Transmembrane protein 223 n=2 Tax=Gryllus longicercus TaxID=2509291 RepID=A0AAN9V646_9ORTH
MMNLVHVFGRCNFASTLFRTRTAFRDLQYIANKSASDDIRTKVVKDVVLFKYENPRFFRVLTAFSVCQFSFWGYLSYVTLTSLRNVPVSPDPSLSWWRKINLGDPKYRYGLSLMCGVLACGILATCCAYVARAVRYLVLHKGGQNISLVTYTPLGGQRTITIGLNQVSCEHSRHSARVQLPLKITGHWLHYVLDMRGEFTNGRLFDQTAGLKRVLQK